MSAKATYLYRIVDCHGRVVDGPWAESLTSMRATRSWHNRQYPEVKPHQIQRAPVEREWEDVQ
jgi:hypothetical protein